MTSREAQDDPVLRYFPDCWAAVQALSAQDPSFADMCQELSEADLALSHIRARSALDQTERLIECQGWIERLQVEMRDTLASARIVPLRPPPQDARP